MTTKLALQNLLKGTVHSEDWNKCNQMSRKIKHYKNTKMTGITTYFSALTLQDNGLNFPTQKI
jgi:hypothetical protein